MQVNNISLKYPTQSFSSGEFQAFYNTAVNQPAKQAGGFPQIPQDNVVINQQEKQAVSLPENPKNNTSIMTYVFKTAGAIMAGAFFAESIKGVAIPINTKFAKNMDKLSEAGDVDVIRQAVKKISEESKFKDYNVKIVEATKDNIGEIKALLIKEHEMNKLPKLFKGTSDKYKKYLDALSDQYFLETARGGYLKHQKALFVDMKKNPMVIFHEMGHALNANSSKLGKLASGAHTAGMFIAPLIPILTLSITKKEKGEKPKNPLDAALTFAKNNALIITALAFAPVIIEEARATYKGNKMASGVLPEELVKKVKASNRYGFATYCIVAATLVCATIGGNYFRDLMSPTKYKNQAQE